ncbi:MAG TPA: hypothetical protein H9891_04630 [Candidatus Salinicoccus stercoripullorum]|uniref:Uncharacterized protein n=1 Tax=Candidatus Salinicoccus stercoripullorum TaxID=2838756 RepID=A0A9D1QFX2_9STAP|nr:hypothetical protein [Candidatus Salinicoccus stercoripullorum]
MNKAAAEKEFKILEVKLLTLNCALVMIYLVADLSGVNFSTQQQDSIPSAKRFRKCKNYA